MPPFHRLFTSAVHAPPDGIATAIPTIVTKPGTLPSRPIPWLAQAIQAATPQADPAIWAPALAPHLNASDIATPKRVAAFLGQVAVEAGPDLRELAENTLYTHADRLCEVFPSSFPDLNVARQYVGDAERIACRAYAGKLGNGDEASKDGWRFRGSGLLQITGRENYEAFARSIFAPLDQIDQIADWIRTPEGAAASACWFWRIHNLNAWADTWNLEAVTLRVTGSPGSANNNHPKRVAAAEAALLSASRT